MHLFQTIPYHTSAVIGAQSVCSIQMVTAHVSEHRVSAFECCVQCQHIKVNNITSKLLVSCLTADSVQHDEMLQRRSLITKNPRKKKENPSKTKKQSRSATGADSYCPRAIMKQFVRQVKSEKSCLEVRRGHQVSFVVAEVEHRQLRSEATLLPPIETTA